MMPTTPSMLVLTIGAGRGVAIMNEHIHTHRHSILLLLGFKSSEVVKNYGEKCVCVCVSS